MNVRDTLYHGDTLMFQAKYDYVKGRKKTEAWTQSHVIHPINLILRSKFKVVSGSWMYLTHPLMVIDRCAKYGMPMSKLTEADRRTDRRTDRVISTYPLNFVHGGIKTGSFCSIKQKSLQILPKKWSAPTLLIYCRSVWPFPGSSKFQLC